MKLNKRLKKKDKMYRIVYFKKNIKRIISKLGRSKVIKSLRKIILRRVELIVLNAVVTLVK